ncbi:hypothetical protein FRC04_009405 [Tulasnella sp. 424]|nr:hypothetical protein FRC04_009405 [Tulasnella sp. 424]KAG8971852.1 hypothetical protein FRC05_010519 [Tulasnella sp. 425]
MPASKPPPSPPHEDVHPDQLLVIIANASGQCWKSARDCTLSLAIQISGTHSDPSAKLVIGTDYDVATALITKVESCEWTTAAVRYVEKGGELEEAMAKLRSADVPFDGSTITADQVTKEKARRQRLAKKKSRVNDQPAQSPQAQPDRKRKRSRQESFEDETRRLAKTARNAGQKYIITDDDKKQLARYLAEIPHGISWEGSLMGFIENREGAGRWSYPTWVSMLRKEKEFFDREVSILRRDTTKVAKGEGKGKGKGKEKCL